MADDRVKRGRASEEPRAASLPGRHKHGKRIRALLKNDPPAHTSSAPDVGSSRVQNASITSDTITAGPGPCLLGVPGLTRQAFDTCTTAFFTHHNLSIQREDFLDGVRVFLYENAGLEVPRDLAGVPAVSELLAITVAAIGASASSNTQSAQDLYDKCVQLLTSDACLAHGGLDAVESVRLFGDFLGGPFSTSSRAPIIHPMTLNPLSRDYVVDFALYNTLNQPPATNVTDPNYDRREALFWDIWTTDAFNSVTGGRSCRLSDPNIGWVLPSRLANNRVIRLAQLCRIICGSLLSVKCRAQGPDYEDLRDALQQIEGLDAELRLTDTGTREDYGWQDMLVLSTYNWLYMVCWMSLQNPKFVDERKSALDRQVKEAVTLATKRIGAVAKLLALQGSQVISRATVEQLVYFSIYLLRTSANGESKERQPDLAEQIIRAVENSSSAARIYPVPRGLRDLVELVQTSNLADRQASAPRADDHGSERQSFSLANQPSGELHGQHSSLRPVGIDALVDCGLDRSVLEILGSST